MYMPPNYICEFISVSPKANINTASGLHAIAPCSANARMGVELGYRDNYVFL